MFIIEYITLDWWTTFTTNTTIWILNGQTIVICCFSNKCYYHSNQHLAFNILAQMVCLHINRWICVNFHLLLRKYRRYRWKMEDLPIHNSMPLTNNNRYRKTEWTQSIHLHWPMTQIHSLILSCFAMCFVWLHIIWFWMLTVECWTGRRTIRRGILKW